MNAQIEKEIAILKSDLPHMTQRQYETTLDDMCRRYGTEVVARAMIQMGLA